MTIEIFRQLTGETREWTEQDVEDMRRLTVRQLAKFLRVPLWRAPFLVRRGRKMMRRRLRDLQLFPDIVSTIKTLHQRGVHMHIATSNSAQNVHDFLRQHELENYFDEVRGGIGLLGKARVLKKMRTQIIKRQPAAQVYYVGDEIRDIVASKQARLRVIAVSWGYNHRDLLERMNPDMLIDQPKDLLTSIT